MFRQFNLFNLLFKQTLKETRFNNFAWEFKNSVKNKTKKTLKIHIELID